MNNNGNNASNGNNAAGLISDLHAAVNAVKTRIDEINGLSNSERAGAAADDLQDLEDALEEICAMQGGRRRRRHARKTHRRRHGKRHTNKKSRKNRKH